MKPSWPLSNIGGSVLTAPALILRVRCVCSGSGLLKTVAKYPRSHCLQSVQWPIGSASGKFDLKMDRRDFSLAWVRYLSDLTGKTRTSSST